MATQHSVTDVSKTALRVARVRAGESRRPDKLFDDPYAAAFVAAFQRAAPTEPLASPLPDALRAALALQIVMRTRLFDEYLLAAAVADCRQVVLLAAGLDTRAYRLPWPDGVRLYELDLPGILEFKSAVLAEQQAQPRCDRVSLEVDLRDDWPAKLVGSGFDASLPTAWLAEGLLIYLADDEAASVLTAIDGLSAPGSQLACERGNSAQTFREQAGEAAGAGDSYLSLWKGGLTQDVAAWLSQRGWRPQIHDLEQVAAAYHRPLPTQSRAQFVTATREPVEAPDTR